MTPTLRDATAADHADWLHLWQQYLDFYGTTLTPEVTARTWARLMDPAHPMKARLALDGGQLRGFAIHHTHCSTWVLGDDCYLEDLFVDAAARGMGLGRALIDDLARIANAKGCHRLYWHTDQENATARALYDSYVKSDGHIRYRMML